MPSKTLSHVRICDFTGQLAGAGATKWLASFGADVIRIEDPVRSGLWDVLRATPPFIDDRRGPNLGGGFNNHNVEKRGITINLRLDEGRALLREIIEHSDAVTENFAHGVMERWGFGYEELKAIKPDIIYVSNCGFGHSGPYLKYKTWGPIVQAMSGLTFSSALPGQPPAGWGYSYMDHTGGYYMAMAIQLALFHRQRTGEGQWVDMSCVEAGLTLNGPAILDYSVNGRRTRREGEPHSNRSQWPKMAPHGIYPARGDDRWLAVACRSDEEWQRFAAEIEGDALDSAYANLEGRLANEDALDEIVAAWAHERGDATSAEQLQALGIPAAPVKRPRERIEQDPDTSGWGLWPKVKHAEIGEVVVDGLPVHFSEPGCDWEIRNPGPVLGEHNDEVYGGLLGKSPGEIAALRETGVI